MRVGKKVGKSEARVMARLNESVCIVVAEGKGRTEESVGSAGCKCRGGGGLHVTTPHLSAQHRTTALVLSDTGRHRRACVGFPSIAFGTAPEKPYLDTGTGAATFHQMQAINQLMNCPAPSFDRESNFNREKSHAEGCHVNYYSICDFPYVNQILCRKAGQSRNCPAC